MRAIPSNSSVSVSANNTLARFDAFAPLNAVSRFFCAVSDIFREHENIVERRYHMNGRMYMYVEGTLEQRYLENLERPASCSPMRGKILKKRSTEATSPACTAASNWR